MRMLLFLEFYNLLHLNLKLLNNFFNNKLLNSFIMETYLILQVHDMMKFWKFSSHQIYKFFTF